MTAVGYVRVSTGKQALSLEAQAEKIRAMATVHGAELLDLIVDGGESAKSLNRPGIERVLQLVNARKIGAVIVAKLDRLTRSVKDLAELLELFSRRGVSLISVAESLDTGSAAGRLVLNIMTAVSQWEREAIGERTRDALAHKKAQGQRVGTIPYGYQLAADGVHVEENLQEKLVLSLMDNFHGRGMTTREIAAELNARGIRTRRATPWRHQYVAAVLTAARSDVSSEPRNNLQSGERHSAHLESA